MLYFICFFLALFASCQKKPAPPCQTLRVNIGSDPLTVDPRKARDLTTITLMHMLFEGLTRASQKGETELALADHVEISDNGLRYVFHLRDSFWSNGDPVTAHDFTTSWKSILEPSFPTDIAYQLYVIKNGRRAKLGEVSLDQVGIGVPDPHTLVVELEQPTPYFLELLSMASFFPISPKTGGNLNPDTLVSNGPFSIHSWAHSDQIQMVKNPKYWQADQVQIEEIDLYMVAGDTEMRMFEEGKLDWAGSPLSTIPIDAVPNLPGLHKSPFAATYFFRVNTSERVGDRKNPFSNASFRKALSLAIDRQAITTHILQGGQTAAMRLVPTEMGLSKEGYFSDGAVDRAKALLAEAMETLGPLEPITLSYSSSERNASIAQAIQKQWQDRLGIQVQLEAVEPKVYFRRVSQKDYQLAAGSWTGDFNDPVNFLEVFKYRDASTNNTNWENPKYIDLLNRSALCRDTKERRELLREAEAVLMDEMPIIPVFHFALNYLARDDLEQVALSHLGQIDFRWAKWSSQELSKVR